MLRLCQNINFADAMETIETAFVTIKEDIIIRNRGGDKGMHGFIAEIAECGIGNARQQILGKSAGYIWINDNGPNDLTRGAEAIQQKFVRRPFIIAGCCRASETLSGISCRRT